MVKIMNTNVYDNHYEFLGYYNNKFFIICISRKDEELIDFKYTGTLFNVRLQNYLCECCLYCLKNNLSVIRNRRTSVA